MAPDLDSELRDLGAAIELPPTPDLGRAVLARLEPAPRRTRRRALRALALATLALLVPAATVLAASPAARDAVLDWLGLRGAKVERVPSLPRVPPGARIDLGPRVSLRAARERAPFGVLVPALLGTPDAVHLHAGTAAGPVVSLVYRAVQDSRRQRGRAAWPPGRQHPAPGARRPARAARVVLAEARGAGRRGVAALSGPPSAFSTMLPSAWSSRIRSARTATGPCRSTVKGESSSSPIHRRREGT